MTRNHIVHLMLASALLPGCGREAAELPVDDSTPVAAASEPILQTYEVPAGRAQEVVRVLQRALSQGADEPPRGTVSQLDDERLVVLAPASVHDGIAGLCRDLEASGEVEPRPAIALTYWIVLAQPGAHDDAPGLPAAIGAALTEIEHQDGPASFSLLETTSVVSLSSTTAHTRGRAVEIQQTAIVRDGSILADVDIAVQPGARLQTRLALRPGQFTVVGQTGHTATGAADQRLYYVVRADAQ